MVRLSDEEKKTEATSSLLIKSVRLCPTPISLRLQVVLLMTPVERSQSSLSRRSRSSQSSNCPGQSSSPWYTRDSSPLPGNSSLSQAYNFSSDFINTQELRSGVVDLINESARNAVRYCRRSHGEDPDSDGGDAERGRPSKRRCDVTLMCKET